MGNRVLNAEPNNNRSTKMRPAANQSYLYGWKKNCIFIILFFLMILIAINLGFTLWILKALEVSQDGIGRIKIVEKGVELDGMALVMDVMKTSHIKSRLGQPLTFESAKNLTFNVRGDMNEVQNQMFIGHDRFEVSAKKFQVNNLHGGTLMQVDKDLMEIASNSLKVEGDGGIVFSDYVQTPIIRAEPGKDLKLESPTRSLEIQASQEIFIQSRAGSIETASLNDIKIRSSSGSIRLDAEQIILSNLNQFIISDKTTSDQNKVYQLCICENGKIFLAPSHFFICAGDSTICR